MIQQLLSQATAFHAAGDRARAAGLYRQALALSPNNPDALHLLGRLTAETGDTAAGISLIERAIAQRPRIADYYAGLAEVLLEAGDIQQAIETFRKAARLQPESAVIHFGHGVALGRAGQTDAAIQALRRALAREPSHLAAQAALGTLLLSARRPAEAESAFRCHAKLAPADAQAHFGLGCALQAQLRFAEAAAAFRAAIARNPNHLGALGNLGVVLRELNQPAEAVAACRRAVAVSAQSVEALGNLGTTLREDGNIGESEQVFLRAVEIDPGNTEAQFGLAMTRLLDGRLAEGWASFSFRKPCAEGRAKYPGRVWLGESTGTLLIYAEQGFGDFIQFIRFLPQAAARAECVVLSVPSPLLRLARSLQCLCCDTPVHAMDSAAAMPPCDAVCADMDLPTLFAPSLTTIPANVPYLRAPQTETEGWAACLAALPGRKIGLAWSGNPTYVSDRQRSIPAAALAALAGTPGVTFVSLQPAPRDLPPAELGLVDWTRDLRDFASTAALISALDLVVTADTAVVHLAGALGRPVWLLNRYAPDWRWLLCRNDSPWYPALTQLRQSAPGDWASVLHQVRARLASLQDP
jgi:tetratricopeptide (TPR) repeat protein